jgi:hypothetical protein
MKEVSDDESATVKGLGVTRGMQNTGTTQIGVHASDSGRIGSSKPHPQVHRS